VRRAAKTPLTGDKIDAPAACAVPFRPYRGGLVTRTQNVSEFMLVFVQGCFVVDARLYLNDLIQSAVPVRHLRSSDAPMLSAARTRTEFARRAFSVAAPHTWNSLPSDIISCHTLHTFKNTLKHTCSDSLNLKPPAPPYPLQDFKALYKYCIIIIKAGVSRSFIKQQALKDDNNPYHIARRPSRSRVRLTRPVQRTANRLLNLDRTDRTTQLTVD